MAITIGSKGNEAVLKGDCVVMFPGKYEGNTVKFILILGQYQKERKIFGFGLLPRK